MITNTLIKLFKRDLNKLKEEVKAYKNEDNLVQSQTELKLPLIALGASAATHYPAIAKLLGAELIVPEHADVAGAVGAAAGSVRQRVMVTVTQPNEGRFRIHLPEGPQDVKSQEEALMLATQAAEDMARKRAESAGAKSVEITTSSQIKEVDLGDGKTLFMEGLIQTQAVGLPTSS